MIKIAVTIYFGMLLGAISIAKAAEPIRIAVIDTGLNNLSSYPLCPGNKQWNFVSSTSDLTDGIGHGTHVVQLITQTAGKGNYCLLIYKYYVEHGSFLNLNKELSAILRAVKDKADIVNFSSGGPEFEEYEFNLIKDNPQLLFVVAAGNEGEDLGKSRNGYYPASYHLPNMIVVGAKDSSGHRLSSSNYGKIVDVWEESDCTSYATAIHTGKQIKKRLGK